VTRHTTVRTGWPLERILFAMAGTATLLGVLLGVAVSPWFLLLAAVAGLNQWLFVLFGVCPASLVLRRLGVAAQCEW
jgi:Zn-dependent protease